MTAAEGYLRRSERPTHVIGLPASAAAERMTERVLAEMRSWAMDCQWADIEDDAELLELPADAIVRGIARNYAGGLEGFLADMAASR
jgi:hypothetical protein